MIKLFITGGSSFLGGYLVGRAAAGFHVLASYYQNRPDFPRVNWCRMDFSDPVRIEEVLRDFRPDIIVHNAALSKLEICEKDPGRAEVLNVNSTARIARISRLIGARIIYISSDMVFDGKNPPYDESASTCPINHYGRSKLQGENALKENNPDYLIIRPSLMYGPPILLGDSFSEWVRKTWRMGKKTPLYSDQYRVPIFAGNLADAVLELAVTDFTGILNLAGPERINRCRFGEYLADFLQIEKKLIKPVLMSKIEHEGLRPFDVSLLIGRAQKQLNTRLLDCREGIRRAYSRYKS